MTDDDFYSALLDRCGYMSASWPNASAYAAAGDIVQYLIDAGLLVAGVELSNTSKENN